jgi:ATP-binding cassette subfamily C protein LapB
VPDTEITLALPQPSLAAHEASGTDPLAQSLLVVAKLHGINLSIEALCAGLPLDQGALTPKLFARAAERAGLSARIRRCTLEEISGIALPVVLLLQDRGACVLLEREGAQARIALPESGDGSKSVAIDDLRALYSGYAIFVGRLVRFEAGTASERIAARHHWFWGALTKSWRIYSEVALATVLINVFTVMSPLFFMNVYDRVVPNKAFETLWVLALGISAMYVFDLALKALRGYFVDVAGKRADLMLSARLFEQVMDIRLDERRMPVGAMANNMREFESLRDFFTSATMTTVIDLPFVFFFVAVIFAIGGPYMALVPVAAIPIVVAVGFALQVPLRDRIRRVFAASEAKHAALIETLGAIEVVKSLGAASHLQRKWESMVEYVAMESLGTRMISAFAVHFSGFVQLSVGVAMLVVGVYLVGDNLLTTGGLIACTIIGGRSLAPLTQVAALLTRYHQAMSALAALDKLMSAPVERPRDKTFLHRPRFTGEVQFRDVSFHYPEQKQNALTGASFLIRAGERVGVIGRIGSGKSTIAKLLLGLYQPNSGSILIDGTDIRQIDPSDLRRNIGYLPQNLILFSGSVRDNLVIGAPHVDDVTILRAARLAGLDEQVNRHPAGFEMPVGERGEGLSGGQRQVVALARALLLDPPILLLDEPTHAMDHSSEERLKARLTTELGDRTIVIVTHRESLLSMVSTLVVVDSGRIVAYGPKDAVLKALAENRVKTGG